MVLRVFRGPNVDPGMKIRYTWRTKLVRWLVVRFPKFQFLFLLPTYSTDQRIWELAFCTNQGEVAFIYSLTPEMMTRLIVVLQECEAKIRLVEE